MTGISKKRRVEILQEKFPEFFKLSEELSLSLQSVLDDLEEKIEQIEEIQEKQEELEELKTEINF